MPAGRFAFPAFQRVATSKRRALFTVAEPRRIYTGLPCYVRMDTRGSALIARNVRRPEPDRYLDKTCTSERFSTGGKR